MGAAEEPNPLYYRRSLASRVSLLTTMAVGLAVTALAFAAYVTVRSQTMNTLDDSLRERATAASHRNTLEVLGAQQIPSWALGAADVKIIFVDAVQHHAFSADHSSTLGIGGPELKVARGELPTYARTVAATNGERYRVVSVHAGESQALVLAQSLEPTDRMLERLGLVLLLFGVAGVILAGLAGWGVARNGLRPVRRLTDAVEDITRTERLAPISVEGNDEIARLATSFNNMLAALSASQNRQRQLVADAGHELRTPLTSLRTNLDLLVQSDDALPAEQRRELLDDVRGQINEMTQLVGDLVELARDEPIASAVEPVELAAVVGQAVTRVRRRAPSLEFVVSTQPWWLTGDAADLERAITNLLDNAAKWSPEGGTVQVDLREGTLMIADSGPGIAPDDLPHIFDRFYRAAESRQLPGSGLGLSIVRAVAERHGGRVKANIGRNGGAVLWFQVPGTPSPPDAATADSLVRS